MAVMDNIYDKFIIVDEKMITDLSTKKYCTARCIDVCLCRHINSEFRDRTAFAEIEFTMSNRTLILQIKDAVASHPTLGSGPVAQIVSWKWAWGTQQIEKPIILDRGQTTWIRCNDSPSIVIRSLKKREVIENPCPPLSSPDDDLTVHIGDHQVTVSAHWLMVVSPVVKRMLSVEMKEKQQRTLNLDGHDITMEWPPVDARVHWPRVFVRANLSTL